LSTDFINPPTAFNSLPRGYSHVVKITNPNALYFVARLIFQNIARDLEASGATLADIVDMTVYLADTDDQWRVRGVRNEFFPSDKLPSSTMIAVKSFCIEGMLIEIDVIAATS
jgi:enamine deaminase RidA (YjgF/YER057c/UK114 family)